MVMRHLFANAKTNLLIILDAKLRTLLWTWCLFANVACAMILTGNAMFYFERYLYIFIHIDDSLCDDADGDCEWKDDGCSGEWSPGKCAGPADRVCCVRG